MTFTLKPVRGREFINRTKLLEEMVAELKDSSSTTGYALYGKRRIGKTSVLKEVQRRLEQEEGVVVVYLSVWDIIGFTLQEFCQRLSLEVIEAYRPHIGLPYRTAELIRTPLAMLRQILEETELRIVYNEIEFLMSWNKDTDENALIEHAFTIAEKLGEKTDIKCVLMIDEFPSLIELKSNNVKVGEAVLRKIRSLFEDWEKTSLCVSGSVRSTMHLAVLSSGSPFYRQLMVKEIKSLNEEHVTKLLLQHLAISPEGVREIYEFSAGIPFYVQFIGKMLERTENSTLDSIRMVEREFLAEEGNIIFKEEFDSLGPKERLIVLSIASGCHAPKEMADAFGDKTTNVNRFLTYLGEKGYVSKKEPGYYVLEDPVFERWMKEIILKADMGGGYYLN